MKLDHPDPNTSIAKGLQQAMQPRRLDLDTMTAQQGMEIRALLDGLLGIYAGMVARLAEIETRLDTEADTLESIKRMIEALNPLNQSQAYREYQDALGRRHAVSPLGHAFAKDLARESGKQLKAGGLTLKGQGRLR